MSNGIADLPGDEGDQLGETVEERRRRVWQMMGERDQRRRAEAERSRERLAFVDTLQSIIGTGGRGAQGDVSVQYGSFPPWAQMANAPGWYDPELPLEKEEHQLPPFLNMLPQSAIDPLGKLLGMGKERVYLEREAGTGARGDAAHEFGHAFDFRNIISNELENKITDEYWGDYTQSETGYPPLEENLPAQILGHTEQFAPAFADAVEYLQRATNPDWLLSPRFHASDPDDPEGGPVSWRVPSYISTMVQELLKRPIYRDHPFNTSGLPVETWVNPEIVEMREKLANQEAAPDTTIRTLFGLLNERLDDPSLLAQQDVTRIQHTDVPDSPPSEASQRMEFEREWRESAPRRNELHNRIEFLHRSGGWDQHEEELSRLEKEVDRLEGVRDTPVKQHTPLLIEGGASGGIIGLRNR